jgi:hypothetical protein
MTIKPLKFREKISLREILVENAYVIVRIEGAEQIVSGFPDGFQMAGRNISCCTYEGKVLHFSLIKFRKDNDTLLVTLYC